MRPAKHWHPEIVVPTCKAFAVHKLWLQRRGVVRVPCRATYLCILCPSWTRRFFNKTQNVQAPQAQTPKYHDIKRATRRTTQHKHQQTFLPAELSKIQATPKISKKHFFTFFLQKNFTTNENHHFSPASSCNQALPSFQRPRRRSRTWAPSWRNFRRNRRSFGSLVVSLVVFDVNFFFEVFEDYELGYVGMVFFWPPRWTTTSFFPELVGQTLGRRSDRKPKRQMLVAFYRGSAFARIPRPIAQQRLFFFFPLLYA